MKKTFMIALLALSLSSVVCQTIRVVNLQVKDMVFNPCDQKIYAAVPNSVATLGNSITIIDPATASIDTTIYVGSNPNRLSLSDDGQVLFVSLDGSASVAAFDVMTKTVLYQFPLGASMWGDIYYAEDIEVLPGTNTTVVVSLRNDCCSPRHEGVAVYENGTMLPSLTPGHTGSNVIEAISPNRIVGYNNETTGYDFFVMGTSATGIVRLFTSPVLISGFSQDIHFSRNRIYSTNGRVISVGGPVPYLLATLSQAQGPVVEDSTHNLVCHAYQQWSTSDVFLKRYSTVNFLISDTILVGSSIAQGKVQRLITWGNNENYAFNTDGGKVVIIGKPALSLCVDSLVPATCPGISDGHAYISIHTGVPPYAIMWDDSVTQEDRTDLSAGLHTVFAVDSLGDTVRLELTIGYLHPNADTVLVDVDTTTVSSSDTFPGIALQVNLRNSPDWIITDSIHYVTRTIHRETWEIIDSMFQKYACGVVMDTFLITDTLSDIHLNVLDTVGFTISSDTFCLARTESRDTTYRWLGRDTTIVKRMDTLVYLSPDSQWRITEFRSQAGNALCEDSLLQDVFTIKYFSCGKLDSLDASFGQIVLVHIGCDTVWGLDNLDDIDSLFVGDTVGTGESEIGVSIISVSPNPMSSFVNFRTGYGGEVRFFIYAADGRVVLSSRFFQDIQVDVSGFPSGMYVVRFENDDGRVSTAKIVKQ